MEAVNLKVAERYVEAFGNVAKEGNTLILPANMSDVGGMIASAMTIVNSAGGSAFLVCAGVSGPQRHGGDQRSHTRQLAYAVGVFYVRPAEHVGALVAVDRGAQLGHRAGAVILLIRRASLDGVGRAAASDDAWMPCNAHGAADLHLCGLAGGAAHHRDVAAADGIPAGRGRHRPAQHAGAPLALQLPLRVGGGGGVRRMSGTSRI
ncbi:hypothetical protein G6F22_015649 [Rhizopus arrhizus]|nr:hypothetical protein G6F22_015649 [Rhizopus arrhizus]